MDSYPKHLFRGLLLATAILSSLTSAQSAIGALKTVVEWRTVDFAYPSAVEKAAAISTGEYVPSNIIILDVDTDMRLGHRRVFVTTPRLKPGTPATLSYVTLPLLPIPGHVATESNYSPPLRPYPSWEFNELGNCDGFSSVFRIKVDACSRLWVVDAGTINAFENPQRICPPQLYVFDLNDNTLLWRHRFSKATVKQTSLLVTIAVDIRGSQCDDAYAYIADVTEPALIVVDARRNRSWRVISNFMFPYPLHGTFNLNGVQFDLMDGILGLALGPVSAGDRKLFFHSLASVRESWVRCSLLRNESNFEDGLNKVPRQFHVSSAERSSQSAAEDMDPNGIMLFGLLHENSLACWDSRRPYTPDNIHIVARSERALQFPAGIKIAPDRSAWVATSRFQNYMVGLVPPEEVNYRIMTARVDDLVRGTACDVTGGLGAFGQPFGIPGLHGALSSASLGRGPGSFVGHSFGIFHGPSSTSSAESGAYHSVPREPPGFSLPILFPDSERLVG